MRGSIFSLNLILGEPVEEEGQREKPTPNEETTNKYWKKGVIKEGPGGAGAFIMVPKRIQSSHKIMTAVGYAAFESVPGKGDLQIMAFVVFFLFLANK